MFDLNKLKQLYRISTELNLNDIKTLTRSAKSKTFYPGEHLIEANSRNEKIFFIYKGLVRTYALNECGKEITTDLHAEYEIVASYEAVLFDQTSNFWIQALEKTETFYMDYQCLQEILDRHPKLEQNRKYILRNMLRNAFLRINSFTLKSPEERYQEYITSHPSLVNRVPDKYIANVLGITPVSLSRIRGRIAKKNN